ncbi:MULTISPECIES: histidine phosphatase family protein [Corynebacterium]|uniref:histidine phosphatase family protein n=1 Tax=Corynebacterium TaxID=1716 RepID=UPI00195BA8B5|nr:MULTISPECIES: histidine phosphatase family protein [Corynebacterium]MDN8624921.1 histidine phosphatase family protein [Corynebacterium kroppenstedtii]QRQ65484.1 histidine phosphatase family protein [Corynebacterium kroppenstedtii]
MRRFHRQSRTPIHVVRLIVVSAPLASAHLPRFASSEDAVRWADYRHTLRRYEEFSDINDAGSCAEDADGPTPSRVFVGNPGPWDVGEWAGKPLPLVSPMKIAQWRTNPDYVGHGGESLRTYIGRVGAWADGLEPGEYITVSDQSLGRALLVHALDAPPDAFWRCDIPPEWQMRFHRRHSGNKEMWTLRGLAPLDPASAGMLR